MTYDNTYRELYTAVVKAVQANNEKEFIRLIDEAKARVIEIKLSELPPTLTVDFLTRYVDAFSKLGVKFVL